jgi:hypothetical protein
MENLEKKSLLQTYLLWTWNNSVNLKDYFNS